MKSRSLILYFVVIAAIVAIWLVTKPKDPEAESTAATPPPAKTEAPKVTAPKPVISTAVEKPKVAPAQLSPTQPAATTVTTTPPAEPRAQIDTAITYAASLIENKDYVTLFREFAPPEEMAHLPNGMTIEQIAAMMSTEPGADVRMQKSLDALHAAQTMTPVMDEANGTATYETTLADGHTQRVVLKKSDTGLWYIKDM